MFLWRTTPALLVLFAPLGLSLTCSHATNTADWSVSATCWDASTAKPQKCHWDVVNAKTSQRFGSYFTSVPDRSYFYCSETFLLPSSAGEYAYYVLLPNGWTPAFELQIVDPGEPTVENCKREVRGGETVSCVCSTQHEGNPPPVISWEGQGTSPVLVLQTARREDSKTYKCEMMWGNRTKTVSYDLIVRTDSPVSDRLTTTVKPTIFLSRKPTTFYLQTFTGVDVVQNEEKNNNASSLPTGIIVAAAAAVLGLIATTTVIVIIVIRRKRFSLTCLNTTNTAEWSVSITCWDTSTAPPTRCHWDVTNAKTGKRVGNGFTSAADQSYFYCSETFRLPLSAGEYAYYVLVQNSWIVALKLQIVDPGEPTVENCKREAREGEKVSCVCSTQHQGSPPPVISWEGQGTSPILLLDAVRREDSKTYKCKMMWGNRTKTVSYYFYLRTDSPVSVRLTTTVKPTTFSLSKKPTTISRRTSTAGIDEVEKEENNNASSLPTEVIVAAAAAVLVLIVATIVIVIIIRRKRNLSERTGSSSGHSKVELIDMSNDGRAESNMVCDNYAEVMNSVRDEEKSTEHVVYANTGTNEGRQTVEAALYGNVEISQGRETTQVDIYAVVEKNKERQSVQPELYTLVDKQHLKGDSSRFQCERESTSQGDVYAVVNKGANSSSHALSAPDEEMYAQVVKSPK